MNTPSKKSLLTFSAGLAAGALAGVLFAPDAGAKTRKKIVNKKDELQNQLYDLIDTGKQQWMKAKGKAEDALEMTKEELRDFFNYMISDGLNIWTDIKNRVQHLRPLDETDQEDKGKTPQSNNHKKLTGNPASSKVS